MVFGVQCNVSLKGRLSYVINALFCAPHCKLQLLYLVFANWIAALWWQDRFTGAVSCSVGVQKTLLSMHLLHYEGLWDPFFALEIIYWLVLCWLSLAQYFLMKMSTVNLLLSNPISPLLGKLSPQAHTTRQVPVQVAWTEASKTMGLIVDGNCRAIPPRMSGLEWKSFVKTAPALCSHANHSPQEPFSTCAPIGLRAVITEMLGSNFQLERHSLVCPHSLLEPRLYHTDIFQLKLQFAH
jgi:hypothetical protein